MKPYYAVKVGADRFDLRQSRYRAQLAAGREHPHDLMAASFTAQGLRDVCAKYFEGSADLSALDATPGDPNA